MKKFFYVVVLLAMALTMVACGGKNESGGSDKGFSSDPYKVSTVNGLIVLNSMPGGLVTYTIIVKNVTYQLSQVNPGSNQAVHTAVQQAANSGIPLINGNQLKARITGSVQPQYQGGYQQPGYQQPGVGGNIINVSQAVVYR